jgi:hypothetical protein
MRGVALAAAIAMAVAVPATALDCMPSCPTGNCYPTIDDPPPAPHAPITSNCQSFQCPVGPQLNCMPTRHCPPGYIEWVKKHCPGVTINY